MLALRTLPRWHFKHGIDTVKTPRKVIRPQYDHHRPQSQAYTTASPDPVEALNARVHTSTTSTFRPVSLTRRIVRGLIYLALCGGTGFAASWAWKTYQYLRTGRVMGLPAVRRSNIEWFNNHMNESSLVQSLSKDGWIEENPLNQETLIGHRASEASNAIQGQHMVHERLANDGRLATRHFRHPTESMTVLVFMADFGCESWPQTLHGGIATTVIQDALDTHLKNFPDYAPIRNRETTMNYRLPLNPGVMYSVLVRTDAVDHPHQTPTGPDKSFIGVTANVLVNKMDQAPRYVEKYNETTKTHERVCKIHDAQKGVSAYVRAGSILFLASKQYRDVIQKDERMIAALREKRDAFIKAYKTAKGTPS